MLFILLLLLFDLFALGHFQIEPKIVGGTAVNDPSTFPYQVSIQHKDHHICGGSIISSEHILTAAHCFNNVKSSSNIKIVTGILNLKQSKSNRHKVKYIFKHNNYNADTIENDIAIVKLKSPLTFSEIVKPIELETDTLNRQKCIISGWGARQSEGGISNQLLSAEVNLIPHKDCRIQGQKLQNGMICAGVYEGGKDACQGDSGGPLVCNDRLVGIVSWGIGCGLEGLPGVYTDVAYFNSWINTTMTKSSSHILHLNTMTYMISVLCIYLSV